MKKKITVLLVDDHTLVRRGFRRLIEDEEDLEVVGEAGDGESGVQLSRTLKPAIVLMDYCLPGIDGLHAARQIAHNGRGETSVIMLTMHFEEARLREAQEAGVRGYLEKNVEDMALILTIRRVAKGELVFPETASGRSESTARSDGELSVREREILQLIVDGKSNREIALQLDLSVHTVGSHRARIMKTLRIHKVSELVAYAIRKGLAGPNEG